MKQLAGREPWTFAQIRVPTFRVGSWCVCDRGLAAGRVYSLGIEQAIELDVELIRRFGATVFAFDPTPSTVDWLRRTAPPEGFHYQAVAVGGRDGTVRFYPRVDPRGVRSATMFTTVPEDGAAEHGIDVPMKRLSTLMADLGHDSIDLLKIDVEGAEYEILEELLAERLPVRQILVEFHHRFKGIGPRRTAATVAALVAAGYRIFFVSEKGQEYSFLKLDAHGGPGDP